MTRRDTCPDCEGSLRAIRILDVAYGDLSSKTQLTYAESDAGKGMLGIPNRSGRIDALACADCGRVFLYARPTKYEDLSDWKREGD